MAYYSRCFLFICWLGCYPYSSQADQTAPKKPLDGMKKVVNHEHLNNQEQDIWGAWDNEDFKIDQLPDPGQQQKVTDVLTKEFGVGVKGDIELEISILDRSNLLDDKEKKTVIKLKPTLSNKKSKKVGTANNDDE